MESKKWVPRFETASGANQNDLTPPRPMPPLIWNWLKGRGIKSADDVSDFFSPTFKNMLPPSKLRGMDKALDRLAVAFQNQENICVYGDYDLDGSSGIALLVSGLKGLGFKNVSFYQPSRFLEGYGIHRDALDIIAARGDKIVISVDCGITAIEEALHARELGIDLIITDHHLGRKDDQGHDIIPEAYSVINPNQEGCTSTLGYLSGVGVGFYLLMGLRGRLQSTFDIKTCLDYFTIGTITDLVPLTKENRVLVKHGLKVLSKTPRPGLQALLKRVELWGRDLDAQDIAFTLAPKLNALSRLELGIRPLDVMMCEDKAQAEVLAEQVIALNEKRKEFQATLEEKILAQLEEDVNASAIVLAAEGHAGVVGLVATKVAQLTGKPAFIVAIHDGEGIGSARGREGDMLPEGLAKGAAFLERFGGHAQAAGFSLAPQNFPGLKAAIQKHYSEKKGEAVTVEKQYDVDANLGDFNENFMGWLSHAGPFGSDNPTPLFRVKLPEVVSVRWLKGKHLKLTLTEKGLPNRLEALAFFASGQFDVQVGAPVELLVEPGWNYYRGERKIQLLIRDLKNPEI